MPKKQEKQKQPKLERKISDPCIKKEEIKVHAVNPHSRKRRIVKNSERNFRKYFGMKPRVYQQELTKQLEKWPVDWVINNNKWFHLDRIRNKLYHEQYMAMWRRKLTGEEYDEVFENPENYYPVRRRIDRSNYMNYGPGAN